MKQGWRDPSEFTVNSKLKGHQIGRLMFLSNPDWTDQQIAEFSQNQRVPLVDLFSFRRGITDGFFEEKRKKLFSKYAIGGRNLPSCEEAAYRFDMYMKGDTHVGVVSQTNQESIIGVLKAQTLWDLDAVFVVLDIVQVPSDFGGTQWKLQIRVNTLGVNAELPPTVEDGTYTTYLSGGARDAAMDKLKKLVPLYNCFIQAVDTGKQNPFLALSDYDPGDDHYIEPPKKVVVKRVAPPPPPVRAPGRTVVQPVTAPGRSQPTRNTAPITVDSEELPLDEEFE